MKFNKTLIALALASTLSACGSDSSNSTVTENKTVPTSIETTVAGQGVKGVLANAKVTVYKFNDNGEPVALDPATELKGGEITTDDKGNYSFIVLDYSGPIKIELSPSTDPENPTTMICDAPAGCGDTPFRAAINLTTADPEFKLAAISVLDSSGEAKVNVSALTHLAAELIEEEGAVTADTISEQSLKIAAQFGITGDITQLEAAVTTDTTDLLESTENERTLGYINAGIMAAIFSGETGTDRVLSGKLASIVTDLVENNGILLPNDKDDNDSDFELILSDINGAKEEVIQAAITLISEDESLTAGKTEILAELALEAVKTAGLQVILENRDDGRAEVVVEQLTDGDAVAKAKAMVEDVRLFTHLFDDTTTEGAGAKTQGDQYLALMDDASVMIEAEADSFELLANISDVLADLSIQYDNETLSPEDALAVDISEYIDNATGGITYNENTSTDGILFNINVTSGNEVVILNASAEFSSDSKSIVLNLDGSSESAGAKLVLSEGSFAQVNLDSVVSRKSLEGDTFEGEITSGELKLDIELTQKISDTVTNPVTFTGMLHTKLLPVKERVVNRNWNHWDGDSPQYEQPKLETFVLPEMLSLSGEFSSLEGDLVSATLTVDINNLADYEAPDFKYIGRTIEDIDIINFTITDDTVVIATTDKAADENQGNYIINYSAGSLDGNWTVTMSDVIPDESYQEKFYSRIDEENGSILYTYASQNINTQHDSNNALYFEATSILIEPEDTTGDGNIDSYEFHKMYVGDVDITSLSKLVNNNGEIIIDGQKLSWESDSQLIGTSSSIDDFIQYQGGDRSLPVNPLTIHSAADFLAKAVITIDDWLFKVKDVGIVKVIFSEEESASIIDGSLTTFSPSAYLTQPLIKDALTMEVSADANSVTATMGDYNRVITFSMNGEAGNFESLDLLTGPNLTTEKIVGSTTENSGLDYPKVSLSVSIANTYRNSDKQENAYVFKMTPVDDNDDDKADYVTVTRLSGDHFDEGVLVNPDDSPSFIGNYSYDTESNYKHILEFFAYNPLTLSNALELAKVRMSDEDNIKRSYANGIGSLEVEFSADDLDSIVAGSTTMFDAFNTSPDSTSLLENEDVFLKGNVALTLEAIFGDYQVKVQLSGEKTALEDGQFDLDMSYRLPGATTQRSFTAHYNTEVEGRLTANNADGVVLVLNELDDDATGTQVLGQILVGPTAIVAATIEDRDGIIMVVYSDKTVESL
jgi:hypothetical protein